MSATPAPSPVKNLTFEIRQSTDETVVTCHGRIITETRDQFRQCVKMLVGSTQRLTLDLGDVSYIDSVGIGSLMELYVSATRAQCKLKFLNVGERVSRVLQVTRVAALFAA